MNNNKYQQYRIVITPGEPAGIGPDIVIMIAQNQWPIELVVCADPILLLNRAKKINLPLKLRSYHIEQTSFPCEPGELSILQIPLLNKVIPGQLNINNNNYVINTLQRATIGCINKEFSALVTGPVHKAILNTNAISFLGHTEFFSNLCHSKKTVMMLSNNKLRVALTTTHIPISSVAKNITSQNLYNTIFTLTEGLKKYFCISRPKIYICGLNPHSGESGHLGKEEMEVIIPTINTIKNKNAIHCELIGPLSADTIFQPKYLNNADVILTMYHDQGLPVLKYSGFDQSVNITFGLPFIRTSVGHGTALELSGTGNAQHKSMQQAILTTINMINNSYNNNVL